MRIPMNRRILDPRYGNNHTDAHFLDALEGDETKAVESILALHAKQRFTLLIPYSVKAEIEHDPRSRAPAHFGVWATDRGSKREEGAKHRKMHATVLTLPNGKAILNLVGVLP